jgi:carboxyvinyl-carboxyphosphonate phosphorylmutase
MRATTQLRKMLNSPGIIVAPGAYDGISARLIERQGFKAVYMTGAGTAASVLGQPDIGLTTLTEMATHAARIASCVSLPVIADADTGYGNALNVIRTVREYERAGIAAIHLEDQVFPKRCGHLAGKAVIPEKEFAEKIRAASENRSDPDFIIIARTDSRAVNGLDDAIVRARLYREAGADVIFVEAPTSREEIERIAREVQAPLLSNQVAGGRTPALTASELEKLGYKIVIFPTVGFMAASLAIEKALSQLKETGTDWREGPVLSPLEIFQRVGIETWLEMERKYSNA